MQILKTDLQMFVKYLKNVDSILKFVAQKGGDCLELAPISHFVYAVQGNDLHILKIDSQIGYITFKQIGPGKGGTCFEHLILDSE